MSTIDPAFLEFLKAAFRGGKVVRSDYLSARRPISWNVRFSTPHFIETKMATNEVVRPHR